MSLNTVVYSNGLFKFKETTISKQDREVVENTEIVVNEKTCESTFMEEQIKTINHVINFIAAKKNFYKTALVCKRQMFFF